MKLLIPILMLLIITAIWLFLPGDAEELALAEQVAVPVTVEQAAFMEKVLKAIEKHDLDQLVRMTHRPDEFTLSTYREGVFAEKNFCPAVITGAVKLKKSSRDVTSVLVKSEPRGRVYQFSLISKEGVWAIKSISEEL